MSRISTDVIAVANKMPCYHSTVSRLLPTRSHASSCSCSILLQATSRWRHLQGPREDPGGGGDSSCHTASMANPSLVSEGPATVCSPSSLAASQPHFSTRGPFSFSSPRSKVSFDCDAIIRHSFSRQGVSSGAAHFLLKSWRASTKLQYGAHIKRWMLFCDERETDPFYPSIGALLDFLLSEFRMGQGRSYSSMNSIRSAISAIASVQHQPAGQHPLVSRFFKGVFLERPSLSQCRTTWDPDLIFRHLQKLGPNNALSPIQLSRKLVILMLLTSGQRGQALHLLDIRNMCVSASRVTFKIGDLLKTSRLGDHLSKVNFDAHTPNISICVYTAITDYLERTKSSQGLITRFFITTKSPTRLASWGTLRHWTRDIMQALIYLFFPLIPPGLPRPAKPPLSFLWPLLFLLWDGLGSSLL
ncbi:uncharacterized protein LOC123500144 isoform X2 [Portunus trituberculatus]|uniref:uncharacterized protein LOC123500144 isoform X2 n=1 Tax=Portunus trituberculatus TaxID=210409 RepID=UPI001E1D1B4D|nr:uncharacterized protein LOC123500144 isoform X2 [Portunus trituberculatus]